MLKYYSLLLNKIKINLIQRLFSFRKTFLLHLLIYISTDKHVCQYFYIVNSIEPVFLPTGFTVS